MIVRIHINMRRAAVFALLIVLVLAALPSVALAQDAGEKVVRVGWYESTYCYRDQYGRRSGIAYEYQQRIAAHTGWTYEYVEDSWPNLLQKLMDGEIDLLSDVSYKRSARRTSSIPRWPWARNRTTSTSTWTTPMSTRTICNPSTASGWA